MSARTSHPPPPFRGRRPPTTKRVDDPLSRLALDGRNGFPHPFAPAVERLGVAAFRTAVGPLAGECEPDRYSGTLLRRRTPPAHPDGRHLSVAEDGRVRASADQFGGWFVQETFRREPHGNGHLLRHIGTGRPLSVAADGLKVADGDGEIFEAVVESGEDTVHGVASQANVVVAFAGDDPHLAGRETEDRTPLALPAHQEHLPKDRRPWYRGLITAHRARTEETTR